MPILYTQNRFVFHGWEDDDTLTNYVSGRSLYLLSHIRIEVPLWPRLWGGNDVHEDLLDGWDDLIREPNQDQVITLTFPDRPHECRRRIIESICGFVISIRSAVERSDCELGFRGKVKLIPNAAW